MIDLFKDRPHAASFLALGLLIAAAFSACSPPRAGTIGDAALDVRLIVHDDRLQMTLFAEDPDVVTPIGLAIDENDRLYVLESHTHSPPSDYDGPGEDLVKVLVDTEGDGTADSSYIYGRGIDDGMNLAFGPDGQLIVVSKKVVWEFYDHDGDGVSDEQRMLLEMVEPDYVYDHAGLLAIAVSDDGWMYIGRGNTGGSAWRLVGTDGSSVSGYGDGGNIMRARLDGSELEEVATGFWNPFSLAFDAQGRLFALDNDPDSRGPNRLLHIVEGGDYGYKSLYGGSGIHPYLAWNGELPGTLPYAVGVGEAPTGLLLANTAALPEDYRGEFIAGIWEESKIVRTRLLPTGASVTGVTEQLVEGEPFRPVAFATASDGTIYITDWVRRYYPNHGQGRIWRLAAKQGVVTMPPELPKAVDAERSGGALAALYAAEEPEDFARLKQALGSEDPFIRTAAVTALTRPLFREQIVEATSHADPDVRLGALLALERAGHENAEPIARRLLSDPDPRIRRMTLIWIGRESMVSLRQDLDRVLEGATVSAELFETYLATVRHLQPEFVRAYQAREELSPKDIARELPEGFVASVVADTSRAGELRAVALPYLERPSEHKDLLVSLLKQEAHPRLTLEAVRSLAGALSPEAGEEVLELALDKAAPTVVRAEALLALTVQPVDAAAQVAQLLDDAEGDVRLEAARYLRSHVSHEEARRAMRARYGALRESGRDVALFRQLAISLSGVEDIDTPEGRPASQEEWVDVLSEGGGDPDRGRRVFFSIHSTCSQCHAYQGRGGNLGPDLTNVGLSKDRAQLIESLLNPSAQVSPEWQAWYVELKSGETIYGRQINVGNDDVDLYVVGDRFVSYDKEDIAEYGVSESSIMPDGLEQRLTLNDVRDLVALLEQAGR